MTSEVIGRKTNYIPLTYLYINDYMYRAEILKINKKYINPKPTTKIFTIFEILFQN